MTLDPLMLSTVLAASTVWLGLRLIFSLSIVLGLIWGLSWVARRGKGFGLGIGAPRGAIAVRAREQVGRNTTIALLEVGDRVLLIGANEQAVEVLAEGADLISDEPEDGSTEDSAMSTDDRTSSQADPVIRGKSAPTGMNLIEALRERSVRRI
ncbi:MAG: flagellar biosynthetic protein FliO [Actinomycetota bacterium]